MKQVTGISKYGMIYANEKYNLVKMLSIVLYMLLLHTYYPIKLGDIHTILVLILVSELIT